MSQYKVTENPEGVFKAWKRGWLFWKSYQDWWEFDREFNSYDGAYRYLRDRMREDEKKAKFKPKTWYFGDLL